MSLESPQNISDRLINLIWQTVSPVPKRLLEGVEELRALPGSDRQVIWVPARGSLKHALFTIPDKLGGRKRLSALDLKIQAWSPFKATGYAASWRGNQASVFAWDVHDVQNKIVAHKYDPNRCEIVPEAFIREPLENGARLTETTDGFEGQIWQDSFLKVARWWKMKPNDYEWKLFIRNAGLALPKENSEQVLLSSPDWLETPINRRLVGKNLFALFMMNKRLVSTAIVLLAAPFIYLSGSWITYSLMMGTVEKEIEKIEIEGMALRQERNSALSALEYAEDISSLRSFPHQIEILSKAHGLLSPYLVEVATWDYDKGILEFSLESEGDMNATIYIPVFEKDPMFSGVSASTRGSRLLMKMNVSMVSGLKP